MTEYYDSITEFAFDVYSRLALVLIIGIFGHINLMYLSNEGVQHLSQADIETMNMAFEVVGLAMIGYFTVPLLAFGHQYIDEIIGKVSLAIAFVVWLYALIPLYP